MPLRPMNQRVAVSAVYVAAMFMTTMDTTIVNVAIPTITREFHATTASGADVVIAFLVSLAVFVPVSSWLGDRLGAPRVLIGATAIFTVASALCGAASSLGQLVEFRAIQGIGGGLMIPVGFAMLYRVFPPAERIKAASLLLLATALAPALGPVLGGLFVTDLSWRWAFYINVPLGVVAVAFGLVFLAEEQAATVGRFDFPGFVLSGSGFGLLMYGVSEGPNLGWQTARVLGATVAGLVLLNVMVVVELRRQGPLLDLRLYRNRMFRICSAVSALATVAFLGTLYLLALYFQDALRETALHAGLTIFPEAVGVMTGAQVVGRYAYPALGLRRIMIVGLLLACGSMLLLAETGLQTSHWTIRALVFGLGFGMSGVFLPTQTAAFVTIPKHKTGDGSTLFNAQRQLGGAIGVAALSTVIAIISSSETVAKGGHRDLRPYHVGLLAAAGTLLLAMIVAFRVGDEGTIRRPSGQDTTSGGPTIVPPLSIDDP